MFHHKRKSSLPDDQMPTCISAFRLCVITSEIPAHWNYYPVETGVRLFVKIRTSFGQYMRLFYCIAGGHSTGFCPSELLESFLCNLGGCCWPLLLLTLLAAIFAFIFLRCLDSNSCQSSLSFNKLQSLWVSWETYFWLITINLLGWSVRCRLFGRKIWIFQCFGCRWTLLRIHG